MLKAFRSSPALIAIFPGLWAFYALIELVMRLILRTQAGFFIDNLYPAALYCLALYTIVGAILYLLKSHINEIRPPILLGWALALILLDQIIKVLVRAFIPAGMHYSLLDGISLTNTLNGYGAWVNSRFFLTLPPAALICLNLLFLLLATQGYRFAARTGRRSVWLDASYLLLLAGGVSSLVDRILCGGSTDFICYHGLYFEDFKDLYLAFGIGSFLAALAERTRMVWRFSGGSISPLGREFLQFNIGELSRLHGLGTHPGRARHASPLQEADGSRNHAPN
ncbi:MAG: signal peptidase II [Bacteroidota bacterium]